MCERCYEEADRVHTERDAALAQVAAIKERLLAGLDKRCADFLADEVDVLIARRTIDSRSPAADALLDYRNPPRTERSDRLAALTQRVEELEGLILTYREANTFDLRMQLLGEAGKIAERRRG